MTDKRIYELPEASVWDGFIPQDKEGDITKRVSVQKVEDRLVADGFSKGSVGKLLGSVFTNFTMPDTESHYIDEGVIVFPENFWIAGKFVEISENLQVFWAQNTYRSASPTWYLDNFEDLNPSNSIFGDVLDASRYASKLSIFIKCQSVVDNLANLKFCIIPVGTATYGFFTSERTVPYNKTTQLITKISGFSSNQTGSFVNHANRTISYN